MPFGVTHWCFSPETHFCHELIIKKTNPFHVLCKLLIRRSVRMTWTSTSGEHLPEASWPPLICFINSKVLSTNWKSPLTRNVLQMFQDYCQRSNVKKYATLDVKEKKSLPEKFLCSYFTVNSFLWRSFTSNHSHNNPRITCPPRSPGGLHPPPHLFQLPLQHSCTSANLFSCIAAYGGFAPCSRYF